MFRMINISYIIGENRRIIRCKKRGKCVEKGHNYTKCIFEKIKTKINIVNKQKRVAIGKAMW